MYILYETITATLFSGKPSLYVIELGFLVRSDPKRADIGMVTTKPANGTYLFGFFIFELVYID